MFDLERMKKALAEESYIMPSGLSREEKRAYIVNTAKIEKLKYSEYSSEKEKLKCLHWIMNLDTNKPNSLKDIYEEE